MAYYAVLSLAPMLFLTVAVCGRVFGESAVRGQVYWEIKDVFGPEGADVIQNLLKAAHEPGTGLFATVTGSTVLLFGASGFFVELRDTMNLIWDAPAGPTSIWGVLRYRFFSFAMVSGTGVLLMVSLAVSTVVQAAGSYVAEFVTIPGPLLQAANSVFGFLVLSILFGLIYKVVPEVPISWRDVGPGAVITACLFVLGKFGLAFYLGHASVGSAYGAAGSFVVLLVWVYYSAQIFLYGAEFTHVYACPAGSFATKNAPAIPNTP